jgi:hypothetical protein
LYPLIFLVRNIVLHLQKMDCIEVTRVSIQLRNIWEQDLYFTVLYTNLIQNTFECVWKQLNVSGAINVTHNDKTHKMYGIYNAIFK